VTPLELEHYLHRHIPLSKAMQVSVREVTPEHVTLGAPLKPNINHRDTVFGGSAAAVAVLAAWSLVHTRLIDAALPSRLVIQRNTMSYSAPITGAFTARSSFADDGEWDAFVRLLNRRGKARARVSCDLSFANESAGRFVGDFVALRAQVPTDAPNRAHRGRSA
jgi:thioesterase domain-containing protein